MKKIQEENKLNWTTNLRVLATISVILLHVSGPLLGQYSIVSNTDWWSGNIYDGSVRFCVPVFVMLTGALLLPKNYELTDFLKKRFSRIVLPFLFWSFVYIGFTYYYNLSQNYVMSSFELFNLLKLGSATHLWYIYMIMGIYLFIPILSKWVQNCNEKEILYFLIIWLISLLFDQPLLEKFKIDIDFTYFSDFIGYLVLGYYLSVKSFPFSIKKIKIISILLIALGISITLIGTYYITSNSGKFDEYFYDYLSPNTLIASVGVFLLFKNINLETTKIIDFVGKYSYGIYLIHVLVLDKMEYFGIGYHIMNPIFSIPLITVICLLISASIIFLLNKIPFGKYISG
jgi:surface polysaccharide O-acyltransferase-like enzyme